MFNAIQEQRLEIMKAIAIEMHNEDAILKGGTGLLLCYGLDRFSEDMDFDAFGKFDLDRTKKTISKAFEKQNTRITQIIIKKDTPTTKRLMFHYDVIGSPQRSYPLKIEFSFRQSAEISALDFAIVNGIKVYVINKLAEKKLNAFFDRTMPRDIYDIAFLMQNYPGVFSHAMLLNIKQMNCDELLAIFESAKIEDQLLISIDSTELIFNLFNNLETQLSEISLIDKEEAEL